MFFFSPLSHSLVPQCSGLRCLIRRFEVFAILSHFKACGDRAGREDEAVPVAGALVKPCAWRKLAEVPAVTAPPLGERLRDCFRTTRAENNSPLLGLAFPFQPLAKHWPRALCTAPSKLRCACRHLYRCVNVDAALGRSCAAYLLVLASFCTGTELLKHKCFCELTLVKDLNFASAERFLHGQSVPALHESGNGKGGQNRAWTEVSACIINRDTNVM